MNLLFTYKSILYEVLWKNFILNSDLERVVLLSNVLFLILYTVWLITALIFPLFSDRESI